MFSPKIQDNFGIGGWVGPGLTWKKRIGKSSQISPILVLLFWGNIPDVWILFVRTGRYYKLLVIMIWVFCPWPWWISKIRIECGWLGGVSSIQFFWGIFLLCKAPNLMNLLTLARCWEKRSWHRGCHSSARSEPVSSSRQSGRRADQRHANLASGWLEHRKNGGWRTSVDLGKKEAGWRTSVSLGRRAGSVGRNEHLLPEATPWSIDT